MNTKLEFEWHISDDQMHVLERLCGTDLSNTYGPMPAQIVDSFIKARRMFVHRFITTRAQALQVFEPRHALLEQATTQHHTRKPHHDA